MLLSADSRRDGTAADAEAAERLRSLRERLEATVSGLAELEYLRQRQEVLVRAALDLREEEEGQQRRESHLSSEEKLLEDNILLLRKQLNCLRRRDAGLISQLQELDRQISDLRLDTEVSHDQIETDSRPSSGFYELSDGASGSLSNSSNSVFSECFCSTADADGRFPSADELPSCLECDGLVGGLCEDSFFTGTVRRSLSAPNPPNLDPASLIGSCDYQSKYHCDLVARNGSDIYRYPSPLHAVAVQSPVFLHMLGHGGHSRDEGVERLKPEPATLSDSVSAPFVPQSSSWPVPSISSSSQTPSHKRLDSYIYSLLQRRALPIRTGRPRTSISTDPSKSILRQASLCLRHVSGPSSGSGFGIHRVYELKPCRLNGGESVTTSSPPRQWSVESRSEERESQTALPDCSADVSSSPLINSIKNDSSLTNNDINTSTNSLLKTKSKKPLLPPGVSKATLPKDFRELASPISNPSPKEPSDPPDPPDQELLYKSPPVVKTQSMALKNSTKPLLNVQTEKADRSVQEITSIGSSFQSQNESRGDEGLSNRDNTKFVPTQRHNVKLRKGGSKNVKTVKVKMSRASEYNETKSERKGNKSYHRSSSKKSRLLEDGGHVKVSKRGAGGGSSPGVSSSRFKRAHGSIPEGTVLDKHTTSSQSSVRSGSRKLHHHGCHHHHCHHLHHGREQVVVVAKPKYKRNDYRHLRAIMEAPYEGTLRQTDQRKRKEMLNHLPTDGQVGSPYTCVAGSDSEYSAECASLFHSTIVDTSEDDRSNYTTNCFGDSESSLEEYMEESSTTSDTEESGGGGAGGVTGGISRGWSHEAKSRAGGKEMTPAQAKAFVKIKASHNLKKKILRFRSGSLKLMTTV